MENRGTAARLGLGRQVLYDNGGIYLFVDAQCNYWVNNPEQIWDETRTGTLDKTAASRLGEAFHLNSWEELNGVWSDPGPIHDAGVLVFDDSVHAVGCAKLCDAPDVPQAVKDMRDALPLVAKDLWQAGSPLTSTLRVIAIRRDGPPAGYQVVEWPLARPITEFVLTSDSIGFGEGILEEDLGSVSLLKELRRGHLRGDHGLFVATIYAASAGMHYELYFRDTLPFEDESGIVPLSVDVTNF